MSPARTVSGTDVKVLIYGNRQGLELRKNRVGHNGPGNEGVPGGTLKGPLNESIQTQDSKKPHEFCILHSHPFPHPSFDSFIHLSISLLLLMIEDDDHYS